MFKKKLPPESTTCLNCQQSFAGWFCPQCGQKSLTQRLTLLTVFQDFLNAISDSDKGFLRTVIDLSQNPGQMLQDYINGKRQRYLSAGKFTFFLVVLFTVNMTYLESHFGFFEKITSTVESLSITQAGDTIHLTDQNTQNDLLKSEKGAKKITEKKALSLDFEVWGENYKINATKTETLDFIRYLLPKYHNSLFDALKLFIVLWIPIFSFFSFLLFRNNGFNFAEHMTINAYIYSQLLLITLLLSPSFWLLPTLTGTTLLASFLCTSFYFFYAYIQFFSRSKRRLLKTMMCFFLGGTTYLTTLGILGFFQVLYIAFINLDKL